MQFTTIVLALAATASASAIASPKASYPTHMNKSGRLVNRTPLCPGIDAPQCCETDVDGVADLTCETPSSSPSSKSDFESICSSTGLTAECCLLSVDGIALVCNTP